MIFFIKYFFAFMNNRFKFLIISSFFIIKISLGKKYFNYYIFFIVSYSRLKARLRRTLWILRYKISIINLFVELFYYHMFIIFKINSKLQSNILWNIFQVKNSYYNTLWF